MTHKSNRGTHAPKAKPSSAGGQRAFSRGGALSAAGDGPYLCPGGCGDGSGIPAPMASPASGGRAGKGERLCVAGTAAIIAAARARSLGPRVTCAARGRLPGTRRHPYLRAPLELYVRPTELGTAGPYVLSRKSPNAPSERAHPACVPPPEVLGNFWVPTPLSCFGENGICYDSGLK
jgi:hypothetical protein